MSVVDSTELQTRPATAIERAAARGDLPAWASLSAKRLGHIERVATLLNEWSTKLDLDQDEIDRWTAAGWLHDILREVDPALLISEVSPEEQDLPARILHGPAAATRLAGLVCANVERAIRYHTIGHPGLDDLGRSLYLADYLEPGRTYLPEWRAEMLSRMPLDRHRVLKEVIAVRLRNLLDQGLPIRPETAAFWSVVANEDPG